MHVAEIARIPIGLCRRGDPGQDQDGCQTRRQKAQRASNAGTIPRHRHASFLHIEICETISRNSMIRGPQNDYSLVTATSSSSILLALVKPRAAYNRTQKNQRNLLVNLPKTGSGRKERAVSRPALTAEPAGSGTLWPLCRFRRRRPRVFYTTLSLLVT